MQARQGILYCRVGASLHFALYQRQWAIYMESVSRITWSNAFVSSSSFIQKLESNVASTGINLKVHMRRNLASFFYSIVKKIQR
jgi:hypothetical protein